jgi:hypothetical protein
MDYNVPGGKLNRGLTVVHTYVKLELDFEFAALR